ncbi:MAG: hypothetical protein E6Q76_04360 [Rhizobium sp.]|nr:MAG: hypothetical protein E6Q76_04360 [Rhizobium sp.]
MRRLLGFWRRNRDDSRIVAGTDLPDMQVRYRIAASFNRLADFSLYFPALRYGVKQYTASVAHEAP